MCARVLDLEANGSFADSCSPMDTRVLCRYEYRVWCRYKYVPRFCSHSAPVLSALTCFLLQYIMLHLTGYDLTVDDLKSFRQIDSRCDAPAATLNLCDDDRS